METISIVEEVLIARSAQDVWVLVGNFGEPAAWHPDVESCEITDGWPPVRTITAKGGMGVFVEAETAHDDESFQYSYTTRTGPLPVVGFTATFGAQSRGPDRSALSWRCEYSIENEQELETASAFRTIFRTGLESAKTRLESR